MIPANKLGFRSPFPLEGQLALPRYRGKGLCPVSSYLTNFVDSTWEASPFLRRDGDGGEGRWGEWRDGRERELGRVCKIRLL